MKECLVLMEATRFSPPLNNIYSLFFLLAEERESYQKETSCYEEMIKAGHIKPFDLVPYRPKSHPHFYNA